MRHARRGSYLVYGLIIVTALGIFVSTQTFLTLSHNLSFSHSIFEAQARQGAQMGLDICRRRAGTTIGTPASATFLLPAGVPGPLAGGRVIVRYQTTFIGGNQWVASVTAFVFDRNYLSDPSPQPRAYRRAQQTIIGPAAYNFSYRTWSRP